MAINPETNSALAQGSIFFQRGSVAHIMQLVAEHFELKAAELKLCCRSPSTTLGRSVAMYLARRYTGYTLSRIALQFNCDYTSVRDRLERFEEALEDDPYLRPVVDGIASQFLLERTPAVVGPKLCSNPADEHRMSK